MGPSCLVKKVDNAGSVAAFRSFSKRPLRRPILVPTMISNYLEKLHTVYLKLISQSSKTAKIKMFINSKRDIYALAHLNLSTASFKYLS